MKAPRIVFALLMILLLTLGLYTGEMIFYYGFTVMALLAVSSLLLCFWMLVDFNYIQKVTPPNAVKGDHGQLTIEIHNDTPFIFPSIRMDYITPDSFLSGTIRQTQLSILPRSHREIVEPFVCSLRGQYVLGITRIEVGDMFGLFSFSMNMFNQSYHKPLELTVSPRVVDIPRLNLPLSETQGDQNNQLEESNEISTPSDLRQYHHGDQLRKIHWKISSKLQKLMVMNYDINSNPHTLIFVETSPPRLDGLAGLKIEDQVVETAVSLSYYVLFKWLPLEMVVYHNKRSSIQADNPQDFHSIYTTLAELEFNSVFSMSQVIKIESASLDGQGSIILVVHQLDAQLFNQLCILKQSGIHAMVFLIQHPSHINSQWHRMIDELNDRSIPSVSITTDQRIDQALEAIA